MTYFKDVESLEQLRKAYRDLLKKYHPDNGGSEETTKAINAEYEQLFKILKNRHESKKASAETESGTSSNESNKYSYEEDEMLREMLQKIIHFEGITIEICGAWLWLSGNTYPHKKALKELGFHWASTKKQWYWHSESYIKKNRKTLSMEDIRKRYGSTEVKTDIRLRLEA